MLSDEQLTELVLSDDAIQALSGKSADELTQMFSEAFAHMKDYAQNNPHHCYDLLTHTLKTALHLKQKHLPRDAFAELRIAALFHDVGKPLCAKKQGEITSYYDHAEQSEKIARAYLAQLGFPESRIDRICFFIRRHDMFIGLASQIRDGEPETEELIRKRIENVREKYRSAAGGFVPSDRDFQKLLELCRADILAQSREVFLGGKLIDSQQKKLAVINTVGKVLKRALSAAEQRQEKPSNRSFLFFPFRTACSLGELSKALDASGCWSSFSRLKKGGVPTEKNPDNGNARYLLKHVGSYLHANASPQTICVQRMLDQDSEAFAAKASSKWFRGTLQTVRPMTKNVAAEFRLLHAYLYCFDTGVCLLVCEIRHLQTDLQTISDSLFLQKELNKQALAAAPGKAEGASAPEPGGRLCWKEILEEILSDAFAALPAKPGEERPWSLIDNWSVPSFQRCFIMTYAESDAKPDEETFFRLSHCYSRDFSYDPETDDRPQTYRNNNICTWGVTTESAICSVWLTPENRDFVKHDFFFNVRTRYLLLFVLLLHQKYVLQDFLSHSELRNQERTHLQLEFARSYRDQFYLFEHKYNFRYISDVPQYQKLYELIYASFKIDQLFADVKEPLEAIKEEIEEREQERENESDRKTEKALTILSLFAVFSAFIDAWGSVTELLNAVSSWESVLRHVFHLVVFLVILVFYVAFGGPLLIHAFQRSGRKKKKDK